MTTGIFYTKMEEEQPSFSVDLVLDASASCMDYQETLAAQSYVIAQSLQKCRIPVQVTSFSSLRSYTVIHRFIRYNETDKNTNLFRYFAAGWNRDGLALRANPSIDGGRACCPKPDCHHFYRCKSQ